MQRANSYLVMQWRREIEYIPIIVLINSVSLPLCERFEFDIPVRIEVPRLSARYSRFLTIEIFDNIVSKMQSVLDENRYIDKNTTPAVFSKLSFRFWYVTI